MLLLMVEKFSDMIICAILQSQTFYHSVFTTVLKVGIGFSMLRRLSSRAIEICTKFDKIISKNESCDVNTAFHLLEDFAKTKPHRKV